MDNLSRIELSAEAALTILLLYCFGDIKVIASFSAAIIAHEIGHAAAIILCGGEIRGVHADIKGFCIDYNTVESFGKNILIAFAGPAAGLIYAAMAMSICGEAAALSADMSVILSMFNLLPAMPLDGGRITQWLLIVRIGELAGREAAQKISNVTAVIVLIAGIVLLVKHKGAAALTAAIWIMFCQKESEDL